MVRQEVLMELHIDNMACGGCAKSVTKAIQSVDPQAKVDIDLATRTVTVVSDRAPETLIGVLDEVGDPAGVRKNPGAARPPAPVKNASRRRRPFINLANVLPGLPNLWRFGHSRDFPRPQTPSGRIGRVERAGRIGIVSIEEGAWTRLFRA
jgi:copper chaperone